MYFKVRYGVGVEKNIMSVGMLATECRYDRSNTWTKQSLSIALLHFKKALFVLSCCMWTFGPHYAAKGCMGPTKGAQLRWWYSPVHKVGTYSTSGPQVHRTYRQVQYWTIRPTLDLRIGPNCVYMQLSPAGPGLYVATCRSQMQDFLQTVVVYKYSTFLLQCLWLMLTFAQYQWTLGTSNICYTLHLVVIQA